NFAFEEAEVRGSRLYVLHAAPPGTMAADVEARRANISEGLAGWSAKHPNVRITPHFAIDEPDDACIRATQRAELVVVGRPRHRGIAFALARPVATQVLRHTHCPVAGVPANYAGFWDDRRGAEPDRRRRRRQQARDHRRAGRSS